MRCKVFRVVVLLSLLALPVAAVAQSAPDAASQAAAASQPAAGSQPATQAQVAALQQQVKNAQMSADNGWMLVSAALVLMMTGPGLALLYCGLARRENMLGP